MNPALYKKQFKQKYLLVGEPGNGKGMLAAYAATIGKNIAQQKNKEFKILTLENNSSYQDGPILKLLENFKNINNKDNHYLIILDEIDSMFTSRLDNKTQNYQKKLVTELLKFTDNSVEYLNKGNYVLISMTNMPNQLDPAFLSRMNKCTYICEGPKTKKEKISLMKKLLYDMIPEDKILIDNWDAIGSAAHDLNLSGRELNGCIENLFEESAISKIPVNLIDKSYDEQIDFFNNFKTITQRNLLSEIIKTNDRRRLDNYLLKGGLYVNS